MRPYYEDAEQGITLYHGDMREVLPALGGTYDCAVTDPPYAETSLAWDRWPDGWPSLVAEVTSSMWCFGSMRMFLDRRDEFRGWQFSQEVVWDKGRGTGAMPDRFQRTHEFATLWYRGEWRDQHRATPRVQWHGPRRYASKPAGAVANEHRGQTHKARYEWIDDGTRLMATVVRADCMHRRGSHPTEKPLGVLDPLIRYACPPGGTVLDVFAGSGSTAEAARASGRKAVLIEGHEPYCEVIAARLSQGDLFGGAA